jgi:hypothetical protein
MDIVRNINNCVKCGVILSQKNEVLKKKSSLSKKYRAGRCKSCIRNHNYCTISYNSAELAELCRKQGKRIENILLRRRDPEKFRKRKQLERLLGGDLLKKRIAIYDEKRRINLEDGYIRNLITSTLPISSDLVTKKMIQVKRKQVIIYRKLKN